MNKLKKVAAVAAMVGGLAVAGGGAAVADCAGGSDAPPPPPAVDNLQVVNCGQSFDGGLLFVPITIATGDVEQNIGNFCPVIGSVD